MRFWRFALLSQLRGVGTAQTLVRTRGRKNEWLKVGGLGIEHEDVRHKNDYQVRRTAGAAR
jgi:hypothetical protein